MSNNYGNFSAKTVQETKVDVGTGAWVALPTTALAGRNLIEVFNRGENDLYLTFDNTKPVKECIAIARNTTRAFPVQDNLTLFGRGRQGGNRVVVTEYK